jgi:hypothetical protein
MTTGQNSLTPMRSGFGVTTMLSIQTPSETQAAYPDGDDRTGQHWCIQVMESTSHLGGREGLTSVPAGFFLFWKMSLHL